MTAWTTLAVQWQKAKEQTLRRRRLGQAASGDHHPMEASGTPHNLGYLHLPALRLHRFLYPLLKVEPYKRVRFVTFVKTRTP